MDFATTGLPVFRDFRPIKEEPTASTAWSCAANIPMEVRNRLGFLLEHDEENRQAPLVLKVSEGFPGQPIYMYLADWGLGAYVGKLVCKISDSTKFGISSAETWCPSITCIDFSNSTDVNKANLNTFRNCPIEEVILDNCPNLRTSHFLELRNFRSLKRLSLIGSPSSYKKLANTTRRPNLGQFTKLEGLKLNREQLTYRQVKAFVLQNPLLTDLHLDGSLAPSFSMRGMIKDGLFNQLIKNNKLRHLTLSNCLLTDDAWNKAQRISSLVSLTFDSYNLSTPTYPPVGVRIGPHSFDFVRGIGMAELHFKNCQFWRFPDIQFNKAEGLKTLTFDKCADVDLDTAQKLKSKMREVKIVFQGEEVRSPEVDLNGDVPTHAPKEPVIDADAYMQDQQTVHV